MTLTVSIIRHIRKAREGEPLSRVSDFQFRIYRDRPILIDLRNGNACVLDESGSSFPGEGQQLSRLVRRPASATEFRVPQVADIIPFTSGSAATAAPVGRPAP